MNTTEAILWLAAMAVGLIFVWSLSGPSDIRDTWVAAKSDPTDDNADRIDQLYRRLWSEDDPAFRSAIYAEIEVLRS